MPSVYSTPISDQPGVPKVEDVVLAVDDDEADRDRKRRFAVALAKDPAEPEVAAREIWPHNTQFMLYIMHHWTKDPEIMAYVEAVYAVVGTAGQLPTQEEYALHLWKLAKKAPDEDTRLKYLRLYAEATGQLKRPAGEGVGVSVTQNRVMVTNNFGSDEEWASKAASSQRALQDELSVIADNATEADVVELDDT